MSDLTLRVVDSPAAIELFWRSAVVAQGADPAYVPQLRQELRSVLAPQATPFARINEGKSWVALRAGVPVGRIFAVKDEQHLAAHHDRTGHFGFLEAVDDDAVWDALFAEASAFLRARNLTRIAGPFSASINHDCGLLVDGFSTPPNAHTNHAPPSYGRQLERLGFRGVQDLHAYESVIAENRLPERAAALRSKWPGARDLTLRRSTGDQAAVSALNHLFNDGWADNWGAVPVTEEEAQFLAKFAKPILKRGWTTFADWKGEAIGALVMIPDVNEAIADLDGKLFPLGWAKLLWRLKVRGTRRVRVPIIGLRRAWRGTRAGAMAAAWLLADAVEQARAAHVERMEVSWMLDGNRAVLNLVAGMPAVRTKTWRIYAKAL